MMTKLTAKLLLCGLLLSGAGTVRAPQGWMVAVAQKLPKKDMFAEENRDPRTWWQKLFRTKSKSKARVQSWLKEGYEERVKERATGLTATSNQQLQERLGVCPQSPQVPVSYYHSNFSQTEAAYHAAAAQRVMSHSLPNTYSYSQDSIIYVRNSITGEFLAAFPQRYER